MLRRLEARLRPGQLAARIDTAVDLHERQAVITPPHGGGVAVIWGFQAAVALRASLRVRGGPMGRWCAACTAATPARP